MSNERRVKPTFNNIRSSIPDRGSRDRGESLTIQPIPSFSQTSSRGKQAMILKNPADDLGMAIIGGREHNLPIIISEIFPGTAVARSNRVRA